MRERLDSQISDSEDSDEESKSEKPPTSKVPVSSVYTSSSSDSSSEEETRAPVPPPAPKRSFSASPKKKVHGNPLDRFISENPKLVKLKVDDVISEDEEVCLLEVPRSIDPSLLLERVINFDRRTKIKLNKIKYLIEPTYEDMKPISLLTEKLKIIHPLTVLKMRENTRHRHDSEAVEFETVIPSLPDNLKVRHPLFGSQYKPKIVLDEEIQKKLDSAIDIAVEKMKKKKHKKEKRDLSTQVDDLGKKKKKHKKEQVDEESGIATETDHELNDNSQEESIFALLESHISGKKKKSHKNSVKEEVVQEHNDSQVTFDLNENESFDISETGKKHKKKKKDKSGENTEVSSKYGSTSLSSEVSEEKHRKKKKHQINVKEEKVTSNDSEGENSGKKRSHKHSTREEKTNSSVDVQCEDLDNELSKSEKRKHKNSIRDNATFLEPEDFDSMDIKKKREPSVTMEKINLSIEEKKKKKMNIKEEAFTPNDSEEENGGKKRKHKNSIRVENIDDINAEGLDNALSKSKKRKHKDSIRDNAIFSEPEDFDSAKIKKKQSNISKENIHLSTEEKKKHKINVKEEVGSPGKKKKHKNSIREENSDEDVNAEDQDNKLSKSERVLEPEDSGSMKIKLEKKNRRASMANSTVIAGLQLPLFEFDVSGITNKETELESSKNEENISEQDIGDTQKHKKKKSFDMDDKSSLKKSIEESESTQQVINESFGEDGKKKKRKRDGEDSGSVSPRKKIKKEKVEEKDDETTQSLIFDLLNKVKSEMDTSVAQKKKRKSDR